MKKQDRQGARNVAALEQRYNFSKQFSEVSTLKKETKTQLEEQAAVNERQFASCVKNDENGKIVSILNESTDIVSLKANRLEVESENFSLSKNGTIVAKAGNIGGWILSYDSDFGAHILRTSNSVYGTVSYSDGVYKTVSGYIFTVLATTGLVYIIKESAGYESTTLDKIPSFRSPTFTLPENGSGSL